MSPRKTDVAALARMVVAVVATEATPIQVEAPVEGRVGVEGRAGAERAVLTVRDAGPGSAPDLLARLFERFIAGPGSPDLGLRLFLARDIGGARRRARGGVGAGPRHVRHPIPPRPRAAYADLTDDGCTGGRTDRRIRSGLHRVPPDGPAAARDGHARRSDRADALLKDGSDHGQGEQAPTRARAPDDRRGGRRPVHGRSRVEQGASVARHRGKEWGGKASAAGRCLGRCVSGRGEGGRETYGGDRRAGEECRRRAPLR